MNGLMGTIALDTFRTLNSAHTSCMSLFPAVFTLWYSGVHVCSTYYNNEAFYLETPVNDCLGFEAVLYIPNVDLYNGHV